MYLLGFNWNPDGTLFKLGFFQLKYYNLLWIAAFAVGWIIIKRIFLSEKKTIQQVDSLFIFGLVSIMLGARLGHVIFYQPELFSSDPLSILLPIKTNPKFEFTGFAGLASHGATIAAIIGVWLYCRKWKDINMLWLLDRMVIPSAIGACFVRLGNFFNSEITGNEVKESFAFAVRFIRDDLHPSRALDMTKETTVNAAYKAIENKPEFASILESIPFRHPAQLYESICYLILFIILYQLYWKTEKKNKTGFLFGLFMVGLWTTRFLIEFVKKRQNEFDESLELLSIGQWLSIPMILVGLYFMFRPSKQ